MRFALLGPLEVRTASGELLTPARRMQRRLLVVMALNANRYVPTDELLDHLWGEQPPASALANLQSHVAGLRRLFGEERTRLETGQHCYRLRANPDELDHMMFERLVAEGEKATDDPGLALERLTRALSLWRGTAIAEGLELPDALQAEAARLEELRLAAVEASMEARLALGLHEHLDVELRRLTAEHPLRERFWCQLMLARYRAGRQADALAAYREVRAILDRELAVEPGPDLRELHQRILCADPRLAAPTPDVAHAPPTGPARLPERVPPAAPRRRASPYALAGVMALVLAAMITASAPLPRAAHPVPTQTGYRLRVAHSGLCIGELGGRYFGPLFQRSCRAPLPLVHLEPGTDGTYLLTMREPPGSSPSCVSVSDRQYRLWAKACGAPKVITQRFRLERVQTPVSGFRIHPATSQTCLGVGEALTRPGAVAGQFPCTNTKSQVFTLEHTRTPLLPPNPHVKP